jgi:hypothetical protein
MSGENFGTIKVLVLSGGHGEKRHLDVISTKRHKVSYREGSGASFQRLQTI